VGLDESSGLSPCKAGALLLEPHLQSILLYLFGDRISTCRGLSGTVILLISDSFQVARITGMSHQYLAKFDFFQTGKKSKLYR
jgi:hypothetical protein